MGAAVVSLICCGSIIIIALGGTLAALTTDYWWKNDKGHYGLIKTCTNSKCSTFGSLFSDKDVFGRIIMEKSTVLILMVASSAFLLFSLISIFTMCCCQNHRGGWNCCAPMVNNFALIGALTGVSALAICEITFESQFKTMDRGWSNIVGWVGAGASVLSYALSFIMFYAKPKKFVSAGLVVQPGYQPSQSVIVNRGYNY